MDVGKRIQELRKKAGLTADELGEIINKDRATIYRYERGDIGKMPIDILEPISKALNVSPGYLMGWLDDPNADIVQTAKSPPELKADERHLLDLFRQLSPKEQGNLIGRAELLVEQHREAEKQDVG